VSRDVRVRPIESCHLDGLLALCREHAAYERADFREDGQVERWRSALFGEPARLHGWMAVDGDEPCGFMTATVDFATWSAQPFVHMDCLYLREPYRGAGIGRAFIDCLRQLAMAHRCAWAEWQTPADNELGIGFYRRIGARAKPKLRFSYDIEVTSPP
jgi:ribosomal protein S18 acetylase RimI-like enzyme